MLRHEIEEQLADILSNRIEAVNSKILKRIGEAIKQISTLKPSQAYQLSQILKYGGSYEEIAKELAKVSNRNVQDIYKMFDEVAKNNKQFAKDFYNYRGANYVPFKDDWALQQQVKSIASLTAGMYNNITNTSAVGLIQDGAFKPLQQAYQEVIDKAILTISQGKQDFYSTMRDTLQEMGRNGVVQYESGRTRRLDSAVRMNILDGIRQLNIETSKRFGQEYNADGIEISVHENPAPDHEDIQGRQFTNEQYEILENGGIATDVKGNTYNGADKRHIGELNCYHKIFSIVIGVSEPEYSDKELKEINQKNKKGFEFEGKHYTLYEGTQLQRSIETEIRRQKDTQILAKASGDMELVAKSQDKITKLTHKYNDLCKQSGLLPKKQRMSVSGYKRVPIPKQKNVKEVKEEPKPETTEWLSLEDEFFMLTGDLSDKNVIVDNSIYAMQDEKLRNAQLEQLNFLTDKYNHNISSNYIKQPLELKAVTLKTDNTYATASYSDHNIKLNTKHYSTIENVVKTEKRDMDSNWHYTTDEKDIPIYTITHEYGHILEYEYIKEVRRNSLRVPKYTDIDKDLRDILITQTLRKTGESLSITEFKKKYFSGYGKKKQNYEWFAETFADYILGNNKSAWTETFGEWLEGYFNGQ